MAGLAAALLTTCVVAVPAAARAQAGPGQALVRVAHFSPDASYVDVYMVSLNRRQLFPNVFYKSVSAYWAVAAGPFTYEVRPAGATPESEPVIRVKGDLAAGKAYTVAAVGRRDRLQGVLLRDDMAPPAPGRGRVRFLNAAIDLPRADISLAGGPKLRSLAFPEPTGYRQVASGRYRVEVRRPGGGAVVVRGTVAVRPGTVTSVALVGGAGAPRELYAFGDAAGSRAAPAGGIRTGAGGTAPPSAPAVAATGAVDNRAHPWPPSATLPLRGTSHGAPGFAHDLAGFAHDLVGSPTAVAGVPGFEVGRLPEAVVARGRAAPVRLVVPAVGIATPLVRLGLGPDGAMQVPGDFGRAGWFAGGPRPGQLGPAVIAGHVDSQSGPAVFYRLRDLRPGSAVLVDRADGTRLRFVVERAGSFPKARFPTAAVFGPVPSAALRLVPCTGDFDRARGSYRDNLVVFASLVGIEGRNRR
jgi:hypothetical protein